MAEEGLDVQQSSALVTLPAKLYQIKEENCTSVSKMSATTSKPAARIVSPVSTRSTEEKNPLNSSTDTGSDKMYLNLNKVFSQNQFCLHQNI